MLPDERAFRDHVARGRFQAGVDRGDWAIETEAWPQPVLRVAAAERPGAPGMFAFRFDLTDYPATAPTSAPWDPEANRVLPDDLWPGGVGRVATVFNPNWKPRPGVYALYHPMDRLALVGHDNWRNEDPGSIWDPIRMDIVDYLKVIHDLLHSTEYSGVRRPA